MNTGPTTSSASTIANLLHQNSMNSRPQSTSYGNHTVNNNNNNNINLQPTSHNTLSGANNINAGNSPNISMHQQLAISNDADANDSQSSVQKIIHYMMMSLQHMVGLGSMGGDVKNVNGVAGGNTCVSGFGGMLNGLGQSAVVNGIRTVPGNNNSLLMNGRVGTGREQGMNSQQQQQQDMSNQLLTSLGAVNGFSNFQFDWKTSP